MVEVNTVEAEAKADAAFNAGFGSDAPPPAVIETPVDPLAVAEPVKIDGTAPPAVVPEKPQYVRLTKQEWDNTKAAAGKVANLESQLAKLAGSAPNADRIAQQVLEQLRSQTPAGMTVEMSDEDFADLAADFPELAKHTRSALEKVLKKAQIKGTGTASPPAPPVDEGALADRVQFRLEEKTLTRTYPDWVDIVGASPTPDNTSPFRVWLSQQRPEYQKAVNETNSPAEVQEAISHFKASLQRAAPVPATDRAAARRAVIEDAVTPRAEGNAPPLNAPQTAEEAFAAAFKQEKAH